MQKATINFKSGKTIVVEASEIKFTHSGNDLKKYEISGPFKVNGRQSHGLYLRLDEIESVNIKMSLLEVIKRRFMQLFEKK